MGRTTRPAPVADAGRLSASHTSLPGAPPHTHATGLILLSNWENEGQHEHQ
jgi:hypothetical protein